MTFLEQLLGTRLCTRCQGHGDAGRAALSCSSPSRQGVQGGGASVVPQKGLVGPNSVFKGIMRLNLGNLKNSVDGKIRENIVG